MTTVSFDFDNTLWDEREQAFIPETLQLLQDALKRGERVIITTARMQEWIDEVRWHLDQIGLGALEVFCAPGNASDPAEIDPTKSDVLIREGASKHFDDLVNCDSLDAAREAGIEILLPPATKAVMPRMY